MYKSKQTVHFFDADPAGVLFFSRIYTLCHAAYEEFISDSGIKKEELFFHRDVALPIIHSEADYFAPIHAGETVDVHLYLPTLRPSSFEVRSIVHGLDGRPKAVVSTIHVCVDRATWKKTELPDAWSQILRRYVGEPPARDQ